MGKICIERATGRVREWVRNGVPSTYDALIHDLLDSATPPPDDTVWNGTAFVQLPPKANAEKDAELQVFIDSAGGKVMKSIVTVLIQKNICTMADIKAAYRSLA